MVFKSIYPDLDIPKTNILDYLFPQNEDAADKPLWIDATDISHFLSPRSTLRWVKRLGFGLERLGIQRDDVYVVFTPNHIYVLVAYLGFVGYGAAFSGLNSAYTLQGVYSMLFTRVPSRSH
jgi:acyl-coenzyme A synthetase/AMP-(fatty) acid ligase